MSEQRALLIIEQRIQHQIKKENIAYAKSSNQETSLEHCAEVGKLWRLLKEIKEFEKKYIKRAN